MDSARQRRLPHQRSIDSLDRRVDQWIETGRQFVDGVSGTRPGQRRTGRSDRRSGSNLENVGKWVGDKLEWLLEDDDDWLEPWQVDSERNTSGSKRPLGAISRRVSRSDFSNKEQVDTISQDHDQWPDEDMFKLDRWQRTSSNSRQSLDETIKMPRSNGGVNRPLPRSTRRRQ